MWWRCTTRAWGWTVADDYDREAVLAQVARRREIAAELAKALPQESAIDLVRRRNRERQQREAERAGRLDLGGLATEDDEFSPGVTDSTSADAC